MTSAASIIYSIQNPHVAEDTGHIADHNSIVTSLQIHDDNLDNIQSDLDLYTGSGVLVRATSPNFLNSASINNYEVATQKWVESQKYSSAAGTGGTSIKSAGATDVAFELSTDHINYRSGSAVRSNRGGFLRAAYSMQSDNFILISSDPTMNVIVGSSDGKTWLEGDPVQSSVDYVNRVATSPDGITVVALNNNIRFTTASNGTGWASASTGVTGHNFYALAYGNGKFLGVDYDNTGYVITSTDGNNWNETTNSVVNGGSGSYPANWYDIAYGNGKWIAVGESGSFISSSDDGVTWTRAALPSNVDYWYSIAYGKGIWVAAGAQNQLAASLDEGVTWSLVSPSSLYLSSDISFTSVISVGDSFIVSMSTPGTSVDQVDFLLSNDGVSWTDIAYVTAASVVFWETPSMQQLTSAGNFFIATSDVGRYAVIGSPYFRAAPIKNPDFIDNASIEGYPIATQDWVQSNIQSGKYTFSAGSIGPGSYTSHLITHPLAFNSSPAIQLTLSTSSENVGMLNAYASAVTASSFVINVFNTASTTASFSSLDVYWSAQTIN